MANRRARLRAFKCRQGVHRWFKPFTAWAMMPSEMRVCSDCLVSKLLTYDELHVMALRRLRRGEQCAFSTGIDGFMTYGYGELDANGYFEYPLQRVDLEPKWRNLVDKFDPVMEVPG